MTHSARQTWSTSLGLVFFLSLCACVGSATNGFDGDTDPRTGDSTSDDDDTGDSDPGDSNNSSDSDSPGDSDDDSNMIDPGPWVPVVCTGDTSRPESAPELEVGVWKDVGPKPWPEGVGATGLAVSPCQPGTIYLGSDAIYRTVDGGTTWGKVGAIDRDNEVGFMDGSNHIRVNPNDPNHLYAVSGVRGNFLGFWISHDGGDTFSMTQSYRNLPSSHGIYQIDIYDIAVDPHDFDHFLLTSHSPWGPAGSQWNGNAGILESKDGGETWIIHEPGAWGYGHAISFVYEPELGFGNINRWLLSTQDVGRWLTTNAGGNWTQVSSNNIQHGGGTIYYSKSGVLFASGYNRNIRSTDDGATWSDLPMGFGSNAVWGDGTYVYTAPVFGPGSFYVTPEDGDGLTWETFNEQTFAHGPFQMVLDEENRILYSSSSVAGLWALQLPPE